MMRVAIKMLLHDKAKDLALVIGIAFSALLISQQSGIFHSVLVTSTRSIHEPTAALDGQSGQTVMQLLQELAVQPNRAAIIATHDPRVFGFADRIAYMEDGLIVRTELAESGSVPDAEQSGQQHVRHQGE